MDTTVKHPAMNRTQRLQALTRDLAWPVSQPDAVFPARSLEGIRIHDWSALRQPLQPTLEQYWKLQGDKDKRLYAITDAFAQNNGQIGLSDARYANAIKLLLQAFTPIEYSAHRGYARVARQLGLTDAAFQSADHLRHHQVEIHATSHFNKYFNGMHSFTEWFDHHWMLSVAKSYADDLLSAGPFEFLVAMAVGYTPVIGNTLHVSFMSAAADNGDMSTSSAGLTAQSDKVRHQVAGQALVAFLVQQDPANLPLVQAWIDKWFWRSVRLSSLVAVMQDYMLPYHSQSWQEVWALYAAQPLAKVFETWEPLGLRLPRHWQEAHEQQAHVSHQTWLRLCRYSAGLPLHVWAPNAAALDWLSEKYPGTFDALFRPHMMGLAHQVAHGQRPQETTAPVLCGTCQLPVPGMDGAHALAQAQSLKGRCFCSLPCQQLFNLDADKHSAQAATSAQRHGWSLPASQAADSGLFDGSQDEHNFEEWNGGAQHA